MLIPCANVNRESRITLVSRFKRGHLHSVSAFGSHSDAIRSRIVGRTTVKQESNAPIVESDHYRSDGQSALISALVEFPCDSLSSKFGTASGAVWLELKFAGGRFQVRRL